MKWNPTEFEVLRHARLIEPDGELEEVVLERPENAPLGLGPKVELAAVRRLIAADTTPGQEWLAWIFEQAGGGARAREASERAMEQIKERFTDERVNGFTDLETNTHHAAVDKEEANQRWLAVEVRWKEIMASGDQDIVDHLGVYGYYRAWPGKEKLYERVANAVRTLLRLHPRITTMNQELLAQGVEALKETPQDFANLEDMEKLNQRVERYFASKAARDNVRVETVFENDFLRLVCPLTYAASVRYGFDSWPFASRATFEEVLNSDTVSFRDVWKATTQKSVLIYVYWKVPMPGWISRKENQFRRCELTNLALEIPKEHLVPLDGDTVVVHDEENVANLTLQQLEKIIADEPARPPDPQDAEMPVKRGPNVYTTIAEAEQRLRALREAMLHLAHWCRTFKTETLESDVYGKIKPEA